jgi:hypothetical protein
MLRLTAFNFGHKLEGLRYLVGPVDWEINSLRRAGSWDRYPLRNVVKKLTKHALASSWEQIIGTCIDILNWTCFDDLFTAFPRG